MLMFFSVISGDKASRYGLLLAPARKLKSRVVKQVNFRTAMWRLSKYASTRIFLVLKHCTALLAASHHLLLTSLSEGRHSGGRARATESYAINGSLVTAGSSSSSFSAVSSEFRGMSVARKGQT